MTATDFSHKSTMKTILAAALLLLTAIPKSHAAEPLPDLLITNTVSTTTIALPYDGILRLNSLSIVTNATLLLAPASNNVANPPAVLRVTGDVLIQGTLSVNGKPADGDNGGLAGPGGFPGGEGGFLGGNEPAFAGLGPGAGTIGAGNANSSYMNSLLIPLIGGSGGAGGVGTALVRGGGGSGGGGAILITSESQITIYGSITAQPGSNPVFAGNGSGGAIRLVAPRIRGNGRLATATVTLSQLLQQSPGRIRIDAVDTSAMQFSFVGSSTIGKQLYAFPPTVTNTPTVQIIRLLSQAIPALTGEVILPVAPTQQDGNIEVQTDGFGYLPTITVAVHPRGLASSNYTGTPNLTGLAVIPITIPSNAVTRIQVWAR